MYPFVARIFRSKSPSHKAATVDTLEVVKDARLSFHVHGRKFFLAPPRRPGGPWRVDADRTARELMGNRLVSGQMFSKQRFFAGGNVATDLATIHATMLNGCCCNRIL